MEFLLRIETKTDVAAGREHHACRAGDVVVMRPDGWAWGSKERTLPFWRIVRVPITEAEAEAFLNREPGDLRTDRTLRRRVYRLDFSLLSTTVRNRILAARNPANEPLSLTLTQVRGAKAEWPKPQPLDVLGGDGGVIG
jgi:hypothetical protein